MIVTELYNGQGLGNQLWCYFVTRSIAENLGFDFGIDSKFRFKGGGFIDLDFGKEVKGGYSPEGGPPNKLPEGVEFYYREIVSLHPSSKINISRKDHNMCLIHDNTKIDGCMQSLEYLDLEKVKSWISIDPQKNIQDYSDNNICVIHIRGGDFKGSSAFLDNDYFRKAEKIMISRNPNMKFVVVTDDILYARSIFPNYPIVGGSSTSEPDDKKASHHIGGPVWMDWTILYNAKNIIISSSSFSFWPAILNLNSPFVIAPMFWGDYKNSDGYWSCWEMIVDQWFYLDRFGNLKSSSDCLFKRDEYLVNNPTLYGI